MMFFETAILATLAGFAAAAPSHGGTQHPHPRNMLSPTTAPYPISFSSKRSNSSAPSGGYKQVVYWGQSSEQPLANVCAQSEGVDTIVLAFINQYGNVTGDGSANGNFNSCETNARANGNTTEKQAYQQCQDIGKDIKTCQKAGKKVLGSIGGAVDESTMAPGDGQKLADSLWNSFGGGKGPLLMGASFDGFDFDIEKGDAQSNGEYAKAIQALRKYFGSDDKYIITGAPQCPKSESFMSSMINTAQFDELYIQFYNNPGCSTNDTNGVTTAWDDWYNKIQSGASKKANMYLGMPSWGPAAGPAGGPDPYYLKPDAMASLVNTVKAHKGFSGVMLWDAGNAMNNTDGGKGNDYLEEVRCVLDSGKTC